MMIGIYKDNFTDYLKSYLGNHLKITSKNIIAPCPFCGEHQESNKKHYHLYISLEAPMFHCFHSDCQKSGSIRKLCEKLEGIDKSEKFIDEEKVKSIQKNDIKISVPKEKKKIYLPEINEDQFKLKTMYLKGRLSYSIQNIGCIKGLIFDVYKFIKENEVKVEERFVKVMDYLQTNFVGFLTEGESIVVFRNIDETSDFKFFKLFLNQTRFLDYYKILGNNYSSNHVVIAEGIFDIMNEHIFDYTSLKKDVKLYAAGLSTSYDSLIKSLVFNEKLYKIDVSILSDRGINLNYYKKIKFYNSHIINKMDVYFNKIGKDFGKSPVSIEKFILN